MCHDLAMGIFRFPDIVAPLAVIISLVCLFLYLHPTFRVVRFPQYACAIIVSVVVVIYTVPSYSTIVRSTF